MANTADNFAWMLGCLGAAGCFNRKKQKSQSAIAPYVPYYRQPCPFCGYMMANCRCDKGRGDAARGGGQVVIENVHIHVNGDMKIIQRRNH